MGEENKQISKFKMGEEEMNYEGPMDANWGTDRRHILLYKHTHRRIRDMNRVRRLSIEGFSNSSEKKIKGILVKIKGEIQWMREREKKGRKIRDDNQN